MKTSIGLAFIIALFGASGLQAQTVWRCGEGGTLYSDRACADGRPLKVADARSSTDVAAAQATAAGEHAFAERLVNERMAREAVAAHSSNKAAKSNKPAPAKAAGTQRKKPPKPFTVRLPKRSA